MNATRVGVHTAQTMPYNAYQCCRCGYRATMNTTRRSGPKPNMCCDCIQIVHHVDRATAQAIFRGERAA